MLAKCVRVGVRRVKRRGERTGGGGGDVCIVVPCIYIQCMCVEVELGLPEREAVRGAWQTLTEDSKISYIPHPDPN